MITGSTKKNMRCILKEWIYFQFTSFVFMQYVSLQNEKLISKMGIEIDFVFLFFLCVFCILEDTFCRATLLFIYFTCRVWLERGMGVMDYGVGFVIWQTLFSF